MLRIKIAILGGILAWAGVSACVAHAADAVVPGPVPAQILSAKKVFISNMGVDAYSLPAFKKEQEVDKPYNRFFAAMRTWGRYRLVDSPADADLVFEIRFIAPIANSGDLTTFAPQLDLAIVDAKTHFTLWTLVEPVGGAFRKATWDKNFSQGMTNLTDDLEKLTAAVGATPEAANQ
jgi:hypothetical protein